MSGINIIRDTIELAIEISRDSGVPVLLMANPGLAKSTMVQNWAARNGYHLETLIGSRFTQEEILGFQARVEDAASGEQLLELLEPHWYRNICRFETQGTPSLLFLDELSAVQENVQGALLQLVFDRTIGHGKKLPESTLVIAAANYKQNIPLMFNIMAPILNRFCIVNAHYESANAFFEEFLQNENERANELITFTNIEINDEHKQKVRAGLKTMWKTIFETFNEGKTLSGNLPLDINNQIYNNIYESDTRYVYNFISGRTVYYLYLLTLSFLRKGISLQDYAPLMLNMVFGLAGLGTNSFNEMQQKAYLKSLETLWTNLYVSLENAILKKTESGGGAKSGKPTFEFLGKNVSDAINEWILCRESSIFSDAKESGIDELCDHIAAKYPANINNVQDLYGRFESDKAAIFLFSSDMQKIDHLIELLKTDKYQGAALQKIQNIKKAYSVLQESALLKMMGDSQDV
jgi:hypothetical protein